MNVLNKNVVVALFLDKAKYTPHYASNVYIAVFIMSCLDLCQIEQANSPLFGRKGRVYGC